jgi:hypothetical protein
MFASTIATREAECWSIGELSIITYHLKLLGATDQYIVTQYYGIDDDEEIVDGGVMYSGKCKLNSTSF